MWTTVMQVIKYTPNIFLAISIHFCASLLTDQPQQDICYVKMGV